MGLASLSKMNYTCTRQLQLMHYSHAIVCPNHADHHMHCCYNSPSSHTTSPPETALKGEMPSPDKDL